MKIDIEKIATIFKQFNDSFASIEREQYLNEFGLREKAFTQSQKIDFKIMMFYLFSSATNGQRKSVASTLAEIWLNLGLKTRLPTDRSILYAKNKFCPDKFKKIVTNIANYDSKQHHAKMFYGRHVYLVDGSGVKVPRCKATLELFGVQSTNPSHYPNAHLLSFCERGTNVIKEYTLGHKKSCEKRMLLDIIDSLDKGSVIVGDCGFHSSGLAYLTDKKGYKYVYRINAENSKKLVKNLDLENGSTVVEMPITKDMRKNYNELEDAPRNLSVRIVKVETSPNNDRELYLMTNMIEPTVDELGELYYERQRVEDAFKYQKVYGGLEFIHPNSNLHTIKLQIAGVVGYYNMMQLTLSKLAETPAPNEDKRNVLNRKVAWENTMPFFLNFLKDGSVSKTFKNLLEDTQLTIKTGRFAVRCSMQPANPHQRADARKKAKAIHSKRLESERSSNLALGA